MFNPYKKQDDALERFRIRAHLRSYVKDPVDIDETLLLDAVEKLKRLPYEHKDPTDAVVIELVQQAYRSGSFTYKNLTDAGCKLVRQSKHRRHLQRQNERAHPNPMYKASVKRLCMTL